MSEKMVWCISTETGREIEHPESVTKDSALMHRMGLIIKPQVQKLTTKEAVLKITEAETVEAVNALMEGETRQACIDAAEKVKAKLTEKK